MTIPGRGGLRCFAFLGLMSAENSDEVKLLGDFERLRIFSNLDTSKDGLPIHHHHRRDNRSDHCEPDR